MNCLVIADVFPNRHAPWRGPYNRLQVEALSRLCEVTVVNPLPWPWLLSRRASRKMVRNLDPVLDGIPLYHPLFWYLPLIGRGRTWRGVCAAARSVLDNKLHGVEFDVILATFAYPHGAAARHLSRRLGIPYVVKARGTDLHSLPDRGGRRERTVEALRDAAAVVAVSRNLAEIAVSLGSTSERVHVLMNGIDADAFQMTQRETARRRLGLPSTHKIVLFVGNLLPVKGVLTLVAAFRAAAGDGRLLVLVGDGPLRREIARRAAVQTGNGRIMMTGHRPRHEVALWMNAADVLVLPSRNEGCPNVVLEALCCGTPVVASAVGAVPDLLDETCGIKVPPGDTGELAQAVDRALSRDWDRPALRRRVAGMTWEANAKQLHGILNQAAAGASNRERTGAFAGQGMSPDSLNRVSGVR